LATGSFDKTIKLWKVETGEEIRTLSGHDSYVYSVSFSPNNKILASGGRDNNIKLWEVETGKQIRTLTRHKYYVWSVSFSPDGQTLASGSGDKTIKLWEVETGKEICTLPSERYANTGHQDSVFSISFSPDGQTLASGSRDNKIKLWNVETGEELYTLPSERYANAGHKDFVNSVSVSPNNKILASGSRDNKIKLWEVETGKEICTLPSERYANTGHKDYVNSVSFSPDSKILASGSDDKTIKLWNLETGKKNYPFTGHDRSVNSISFSPNGQTLASGSDDNTIKLWNLETGEEIRTLNNKYPVFSVSFSPDSKILASGSDDHKIKLWNLETGEEICTFTGHEDSVISISFSPDSKTLASASSNGTIKLWKVETGEESFTLTGRDRSVNSVSFSPDGQTLASGSDDGTIKLWEVETGSKSRTLTGHDHPVLSVSFSPDRQTLASGSTDHKIKLWNLETGKQIRTLTGHDHPVLSVSFSPDGQILASGSSDQTVLLWDLSDPQGKRHLIIGKHEGEVYSVVFDTLKDKEGKYQKDYIISAGEDGIKAWRWPEFNITRVPQAFRNDQATGEDSLDVAKELQSLADVLMLRSLEPPLAVAILGNWGSGKSFGMHLIEKQITKIRCQQLKEIQTWGKTGDEPNLSPYVGHVYQIKFNAWSYAKSDLWASLMQTIFDQLDRQLTLEKQLGEVSDLLVGGDVWRVVNQMSNSDRKAILESELSPDLFERYKTQNNEANALWDILSEVREKEQEKLQNSQIELQQLESEIQNINQKIEKDINIKYQRIDIVISVIFQLNKLRQNKIAFNFLLNVYGVQDNFLLNFYQVEDEDREDSDNKIPIVKELTKYQMIKKIGDLIENKDSQINTIIQKYKKANNFLSQAKIKLVRLWEFCKDKENKNKLSSILLIVLCFIVIVYVLRFHILPTILPKINSYLVSCLASTGILGIVDNLFNNNKSFKEVKEVINFISKIYTNFQEAKKDSQDLQQKLVVNKNKEIQDKRDKNKQEIEILKAQVERQKQRVGLTAQYTSLLDFVNNRLEENSYQKLLGIMNQVQRDLSDLSDHLTYIPGKTNPDKLKVLKKLFPRGPVRIVLYIDDLDRCPPDKVVQVLESVQLLLNTNIFIIVLAIDDRYIGRALEQTYKGVLKRGGTPSGVDYIEKIIQLPYRMRPISKDVAESYLKSLLDIEEETKQENPNISNSQPVIQKSIVLEQRIEHDESKFLLEDGSKLLLEDGSKLLLEDEIEEYPVEIEIKEKITEDDISQPQNKESNSESKNRKTQHSANSDPLVSFERFTAEEFQWIKECCQHVDLTPRTAKRLINICKIIRIIWTPTENDRKNDTTWRTEPTPECKKTLIAFLALAGRYPKEMRKLLEEIYLEFEETETDTVIIEKEHWLNRLQNLDIFMDRHNQREWKRFKNDFRKMPPEKEFVFEKRTFNLVTSFCFVGDIGYDPDDNHNREYRFEDSKKQYGFQKN
jgi:WD40 repeat protein